MGKVYGLHRLELRPGVDAEEFERFARQSLQQGLPVPGWRVSLLKGDRGEQVGAYLFLFEIDSLEARDRVVGPDGPTDEGQQWIGQVGPLLEQWRQFTTQAPGIETPFTDYHEVSG